MRRNPTLPLSLLIACLAVSLAIALAGRAKAGDALVTTRMLVEVTDLSSLALSPDGSHVAFRQERASIERNLYQSAWYVQ